MDIPPRFQTHNGRTRYSSEKKTLYGLKQSPSGLGDLQKAMMCLGYKQWFGSSH